MPHAKASKVNNSISTTISTRTYASRPQKTHRHPKQQRMLHMFYESDHSPPERRPASLLGGNLETTTDTFFPIDPTLMASYADAGYFQDPQWNVSNVAVREYECSVAPYEDEEAERLMLRRSTRSRRFSDFAVDDSVAAASNTALCGYETQSSSSPSPSSPGSEPMKCKWSTRLSETFIDLGRTVKKRAGSWSSWRRDSTAVVPEHGPVVLVGTRGDRSSEVASVGSGEHSRDGDDELSSEEELLLAFASRGRRPTPWPGMRLGDDTMAQMQRVGTRKRVAAQSRPVADEINEPVQFQYPSSAMQPPPCTEEIEDPFQHGEETLRNPKTSSAHRLAMIEREVRIAEREGAFTDASREKTLRQAHRLRRGNSEQSQASIKLKVKVARAKTKSDKQFRRWSKVREGSPISRVLSKVWGRKGGKTDSEAGSGEGSALTGSAEESSTSGGSSETSIDDAEAARYVGLALQQAPRPI